MPLPPEEIEFRRFLPAFRGYDRDEVETFLRAVAADYRKLQRVGQRSADHLVIEICLPASPLAPSGEAAEGPGNLHAELRCRVARLQELVVHLTNVARSGGNGSL